MRPPSLKAARFAAGCTQKDVAQRLRVRQQTVGKWERQEQLPTLEHICQLSRLYQLPPVVLFPLLAAIPPEPLVQCVCGTVLLACSCADPHVLKRLACCGRCTATGGEPVLEEADYAHVHAVQARALRV